MSEKHNTANPAKKAMGRKYPVFLFNEKKQGFFAIFFAGFAVLC
jgi:hypothetical protein